MPTWGSEIAAPFFERCVLEAAATPGMLAEYDRLSGTNLARRGAPLDLMIDEATGRMEGEIVGFVQFVRECVYVPLMQRAAQEGKILTEWGPMTPAQAAVLERNLAAFEAAYDDEMVRSGDVGRAVAAAEAVPWQPLPKEG